MGVAQKYPVWEANRTVFVYPENWLRGFLAGPNTGRELIEMVDFSFASVYRPQVPRRPTSDLSQRAV